MPIKQAEVDKFMSEVLQCYHCKKCATLRQDKIHTYCQGCDQFFCCFIAGRCRCCSGAYCLDCISKTTYIINKKLDMNITCESCDTIK